MHLKTWNKGSTTCVGAYYYVAFVNDESMKAMSTMAASQTKCSKTVEYKLIEADRWEEFYCCSDHVQFYRDENERANREAFLITNL